MTASGAKIAVHVVLTLIAASPLEFIYAYG